MRKLIILLVSLISVLGCSSTTVVRATDPDTRIFIDGEYAGLGQAIHTDQKILGSITDVTFRKNGCDAQQYRFSRNERVDAGAVIGGILFLFPFLWTMKYKPERTYEFRCEHVYTPLPTETAAQVYAPELG